MKSANGRRSFLNIFSYIVLFFASFIFFFLYVSFPLEDLATRMKGLITQKTMLDVEFDEIDLNPISELSFNKIKLEKKLDGGDKIFTIPVKNLDVDISLLDLLQNKYKVEATGKLSKKKFSVKYSGNPEKHSIKLNLKKFDLKQVNFEKLMPVNLTGSLSLKSKLKLQKSLVSTLNGDLKIEIKNLKTLETKYMGMNIPSLTIGSVTIPAKIVNGQINITRSILNGSDLGGQIRGNIGLQNGAIDRSRVNLKISILPLGKLKEFIDGLGPMANMIPKKDDKIFLNLVGTFANIRLN